MDQSWFEMGDVKKRWLNSAVWIPLRANNTNESAGKFGFVGYKEDYFGAGSLAVPLSAIEDAEHVDWMDIGIDRSHRPNVSSDAYLPADDYYDGLGVHLVLVQRTNQLEPTVWHLHQDLVIALGLQRESDVWVCPNEGYVEVARLRRDDDGAPSAIEIRAEFLNDYLCARGMRLRVSSYRSRTCVAEDASHIRWPNNSAEEHSETDNWEAGIGEIYEGGRKFGIPTTVISTGRLDVDTEEDVPVYGIPTDGEVESSTRTFVSKGRKLFVVKGELWRNEWVDPGPASYRVGGDKAPPTVFFITDAQGKRENREALVSGGRWLWFRPELVMTLAHRRGGQLRWHTRDTGSVRCSPDDSVHFGVNKLGLVNVYAKDIALLPEWQQQIWSGHNVGPEGGVSEELLASQMQCRPADTQAPEAFLGTGLELLAQAAQETYRIQLLRPHNQVAEILERCHRFRAVDSHGLFALAKDLARLTADSIDAGAIHRILGCAKNDRPGSLKSLERLLATIAVPEMAREAVAPLVGIYEMRLADAHLPSSQVQESFALVGIDRDALPINQGFELLKSCVTCLHWIAELLEHGKTGKT